MIHIARDFAAFGAMVCFCTTLAVWGDVLLSVGLSISAERSLFRQIVPERVFECRTSVHCGVMRSQDYKEQR